MKNLCLALALCLCLTACGGPGQREPAPSQSSQPSPDPTLTLSGPGLDPTAPAQSPAATLTSPPELTVSTLYNADRVTAASGNFSWRSDGTEGLWHDVIACGVGPLYDGMEWPLLYTAFGPGVLPPPEEGEFVSSIMPVYFLDFGLILPDTVTARRWPVSSIGQTADYDNAEEVAVEWVEGAEGRVPYGLEAWVDMAGCYALYPLGDGEFVYEVHADWGGLGEADYIFQTLPQVRDEG